MRKSSEEDCGWLAVHFNGLPSIARNSFAGDCWQEGQTDRSRILFNGRGNITSFIDLEDKPYYIPFIEMSDYLQKSLNYESKLDRSPERIHQLMEDGRLQAKQFLEERSQIG